MVEGTQTIISAPWANMSYTQVLSSEPASFVAGDSVSWSLSFSDYPYSDGWRLSYALVKDGATTEQVTFSASADGDAHVVELPASTTAGYTVGTYHFEAYITNGSLSERYTVREGQIEITTNLAAATNGIDARSWVQVVYENLKDVITGKSSQGDSSFSVEGRAVSKMSWEEIEKAFAKYESRYLAEKRAKTGKRSRLIKTRFVSP